MSNSDLQLKRIADELHVMNRNITKLCRAVAPQTSSDIQTFADILFGAIGKGESESDERSDNKNTDDTRGDCD